MKKGRVIWIVVLVVVLIALGIYFLYFNKDYKISSDYEKYEILCNELSGSEKDCCMGSLMDASERGWLILENGSCPEGYESVMASCVGSLIFCFEGEGWRDVIRPVNYSNIGE
ncbi:MAG: hypothetical protein V1889_01050 [archaeon]